MASTSPDAAARPLLAAKTEVRRAARTLSAEIEGEIVALDPDRGACYGLNRVASRAWTLMERPITFDRLCATLVAEYAVDTATCEREVADLLGRLIGEGLAQVGAAGAGA